jgi:hypothetical protein
MDMQVAGCVTLSASWEQYVVFRHLQHSRLAGNYEPLVVLYS